MSRKERSPLCVSLNFQFMMFVEGRAKSIIPFDTFIEYIERG